MATILPCHPVASTLQRDAAMRATPSGRTILRSSAPLAAMKASDYSFRRKGLPFVGAQRPPRTPLRRAPRAGEQPGDDQQPHWGYDSDVDEPSTPPASSGRGDSMQPGGRRQQQQQQSTWQRSILQAPLELGTSLSKEDAHYLEKRGRSKWWSRESFPKVPADKADAGGQTPPLRVWQKVAPLGAIFFAASFNLTILQSLKDAIMVTTAGAETLPWLASCVVLPASLAFFVAYGRLVEALPAQSVFYAAVSPLVAFYVFFAAVLNPLSSTLHPHALVAAIAPSIPAGLHGLLKVVEHWTFSLFFCSAELWGSVVISVLFWSLANEVCSVEEARAVYPLMGVAANVALVLAGGFVKVVNAHVPAGATLGLLVAAVVGMTGAMLLAKAAIDRWVIGPYCSIDAQGKPPGKKRKTGSLAESLKVLGANPKVLSLALLVVSYGVSHRLFEFAWKGQLRVLYPTQAAYQSILADVSIATGWATITFMLLGKYVFQYLGWGVAAAATPAVMLAAGAAFFGMSIAANMGISVAGLGPAAMAVSGAVAGAVTQVFARSSKFSLFDPAKEMVYIEMSKEEKSKGKAAVDLLGSQIGKSGGAWITQALLLLTGSITASLPIIAAIFMGVIAAWLTAVGSLGRLLKEYEDGKASGKAGAPLAPGPAGAAVPEDGATVAAAPADAQPQAA